VMFSCDWSEGRIWAIKMQPDGASYRASSEVFLKGKPLNATDIEVGPDGGLYMFTGGRGTKTLLYRVRYAGIGPQTKPVNVTPLLSAIRQPQPSSAWSRQRVAAIKQQVGGKWNAELPLLVRDTKATEADRVSALRTMGWYGPPLSKEFLLELSVDKQPAVRAAACTHLGQLESDDAIADRLVELVADGDAHVRRRALESLRRGNYKIATNGLIRSLSTVDRFESWSARRQLETLPADSWYPLILKTDVPREFLQLALARLIVDPDKEFSVEAIARVTELLNEYVSDRDFTDMMRLVQVAMIRGNVTAEDMPRLGEIIAEEFPADNPNMNRELIRILSYLREASIKNRYLKYLDSDLSPADRLHVVAHLRLLGDAWNTEDKVKLLRAIHRDDDEEQSLPPYIQNIGRDLASLLSPDEHRVILAGGSIYPEAALAVLYELPADLSLEQIQELQVLDRRLINVPGPSADRLRAGIVAVLARGADDRAMEYLRYAYDRDVERRPTIAIGLAQNAKGPNWAYLLRSLPVLDEATCREVLQQLSSVAQKPAANDAASVGYYHDVVDVVGKYTGETAEAAIALLEKWQSIPPRGTDVSLPQAVAKWRQWYVQQYPRGPQLASLATATPSQHHTLDSLLSYLNSHPPATPADVQHGAAVFEKAQCGKCHRFGSRGESMGPDLSQVAQRFTQRDLLVSILEPSRAISDQYVSKTLVDASGKSHTGIVGSGGRRDYVVLKSDGTKVRIPREEVEEIVPSTTSVMPSGLLDSLTVQEVYELVAYLSSSSQASHRVAGRAATQSQIKKR
ncbi:MAG: HEAT repeat domain-containing protein, partial [Planctomycetota bacterium]|nr:HEAT repeat domain-containing protein [Planctomycetota bacterium]